MKSGPARVGVAERKILIALTYYVILVVLALTSYTLASRNVKNFYQQLFGHFSCKVGGHSDLEMPACDRNQFRQHRNPVIDTFSGALYYMVPVVNLIYAVDISALRSKFRMYCRGKKIDHDIQKKQNTTSSS